MKKLPLDLAHILFFILLGALLPTQYLFSKLGLPQYIACITYSVVALLSFYFITIRFHKETKQLSTDVETGFYSRAAFNLTTLPSDLTYILFIRLPSLEDALTHYGAELEEEALEKIAQFLTYAIAPITKSIYRYGDQSLVAVVTTSYTLSDFVNTISAAIRKVYQYAIPFPKYSYELRAALHVGILQVTKDIPVSKYIEYARFPLLFVDSPKEPSVRIFNNDQYRDYMAIRHRQTHVAEVITDEHVKIVFQPIQICSTGELYGYEALTRPTLKEFKHVGELLEDADEVGLYINLELCLTHAAVRTFKEKNIDRSIKLFLNLAPEAIRSEAYTSALKAGLLSGVFTVLEIVERGEVLPDIVRMLRTIANNTSALVALDDFGTGYSNHLALLNARPDIIKVSRELLIDIDKDHAKQEVYMNIVMFARNLHTQVLAEGIETEEEYQTLLRLGMDYAQGYFIGRPNADPIDISSQAKLLCKQYHNI